MPTNNVTINYAEEEAFFRAEREPKLQDVAFTASPGVDLLIARSLDVRPVFRSTAERLKFKAKGMAAKGRLLRNTTHYEHPIVLNKLTGMQKSSGGGVNAIDNQPVDETSVARWEFSEYYQPVAISELHWAAANSGGSAQSRRGARLSLIQQKAKSAYQTSVEEVAEDLFGVNTSANSGLFSISAGVGNSASDTTTYGNISRSTYNAWVGNYTARTSGSEDDVSSADYILRAMQSDLQSARVNGANPSMMVFMLPSNLYTAVWEAYMGIHDATGPNLSFRTQLQDGSGLPDVGFDGLTFGKVPIIEDPWIPTNKMILLDTETSYFVGLNGSVFDMSKWNMSENSTMFYARVNFFGQFVVTAPRRNAISVYS